MSENVQTALLLLLVGMITVFIILSLVVLTGNLLIKFVNRFYPDAPIKGMNKLGVRLKHPSNSAIVPAKLAAITAAVQVVTEGKGRITKIEKIE